MSTAFILVQPPPPEPGLEIWTDWESGVDGNLRIAPHAWRVGDCLHLQARDLAPAPTRVLGPFTLEEWQALQARAVWVVCGVSGPLASHVLAWNQAPQPTS